ncbi:MAG TPA: GNAT family N-acetyltransferase [Actinomycetes bacterium]|nr:GNAT family N-acetyltransferase [Actinomycetes bacterium]
MSRYRLTVGDRDVAGVETGLRAALYRFNVETTGLDDGDLLVVELLDDAGDRVAGLFGWTWGGTCFVDLLHVEAGHRGRGLGSRLLATAEEDARRRGCRQVVLATHTFQAPEFYAGRGYREVGRVEGYPAGHAQVHLVKQLD